MRKPAVLDHDIHPLLRERYSPRAFNGQPLAEGVLRQLLEAARWAASCFNEQPWRFIVATRQDGDAFDAMLGCLAEANQSWARNAGALLITVARTTFSRNDKPNRHALHDVGLAVGALSMQAQALGVWLHQMAGFSADKARETYGIPEGYEPVTAIAIGYGGDPSTLPDGLRERELAPRTRHGQAELVFSGSWGKAANLDGEDEIEELLAFWFGELDEAGLASDAARQRWWRKDAAFDEMLRERYGALHQQVVAGERGHWLRSARGRLAYVIVLDQLSRNLHRDTAEMYATDARALAVAAETVEVSLDVALRTDERVFLYMPFMHAESIDAQDRCVALMRQLAESCEGAAKKAVDLTVDYAEKHRDIVKQWGRFPHRNSIVGRDTSDAEAEFLKQPGSSF